MKALSTAVAMAMVIAGGTFAQAENWKNEMPKPPVAPVVKGGSLRVDRGFITAPDLENALQAALSLDISDTEVGMGILDVGRSLLSGQQIGRVRFVKHSNTGSATFECRLTYKQEAMDAEAIVIDECETASTETMSQSTKLSRSSVVTPFKTTR